MPSRADWEGTFSNKPGEGFSLTTLARAVQRLNTCGICGLALSAETRIKKIGGWMCHAECSKGMTDDFYRSPDA